MVKSLFKAVNGIRNNGSWADFKWLINWGLGAVFAIILLQQMNGNTERLEARSIVTDDWRQKLFEKQGVTLERFADDITAITRDVQANKSLNLKLIEESRARGLEHAAAYEVLKELVRLNVRSVEPKSPSPKPKSP